MHVRDFVLANKDEIICARGLNEPKLGCFAQVWARVTEMKRKAEKEPERVSKKRKELVNESPLVSMFQKKQTANDLN